MSSSSSSTTRRWSVSPSLPAKALDASQAVTEAAKLLAQGEVVAFPTETVYGLGGDARSDKAVAGIFAAKGRPSDNPLIVHVASKEQYRAIVGGEGAKIAAKLIDTFWPGPLTVVVRLPQQPTNTKLSKLVTAGLDTVGIRMPNHPVALSLIRVAGVPVAAPSANTSGKPSPTCAAHVAADLSGRIAGLLDGGATGVGLESTVVDCTDNDDNDSVTILRPGGVTMEQLEAVVGTVKMDPSLLAENMERRIDSAATITNASGDGDAKRSDDVDSESKESSLAPRAPGMKYTHYAPRAPVRVVKGDATFMHTTALRMRAQNPAKPIGFLVTREMFDELVAIDKDAYDSNASSVVRMCGTRKAMTDVAQQLFHCLRSFNDTSAHVILAEYLPSDGIGLAVMNRLLKAAGKHVISEADT